MSDNPFDFSEFRSTPAPPDGATAGDIAPATDRSAPDAFGGWPGGTGAEGVTDGPALTVAGPPLPLLMVAAGLALVGIGGAALASGRPWLAVTSWLLAGPAAFTMLGLYSHADTRRRARPLYVPPRWAPMAYWTVVALLLVALVGSALRIGEWVGRL